MEVLLAPRQLGYDMKRGSEAAVHAARRFVCRMESDEVFVKLDFSNAFNSLRWDKMLGAVEQHTPILLPFVHSSYSIPSLLFWGDKVLESTEGVQQGDPLSPLLFCLSIHSLTSQLVSDFKVFYFDGRTLGGSCADALQDHIMVEAVADELGLKLNRSKSAVMCHDSATLESFLSKFPGFQVTFSEKVTLLGSTLNENVDIIILEKVRVLRILGDRIHHFQVQDAILLLRYSLAVPELLYLLRCSPCFQSPIYNYLMKSLGGS